MRQDVKNNRIKVSCHEFENILKSNRNKDFLHRNVIKVVHIYAR